MSGYSHNLPSNGSDTEEDEPKPKVSPAAPAPPCAEVVVQRLVDETRCSRKRAREALARAGGDPKKALTIISLEQRQHQQQQLQPPLHRPVTAAAGDEALAQALQQEEFEVEMGDDEALARRLQQRYSGTSSSPAAMGGGASSRPCRYGMQCRHMTTGCRFLHLSQAETCRLVNEAAKQKFSTIAPPPRRIFDCSAQPLHLNQLGPSRGGGASASHAAALPGRTVPPPPMPSELSKADLMWHPPFLQHALFATYGVDYAFVQRLIAGSPATERPGGVTIVSGNDHTHEASGCDTTTYAPWTVVMPKFYEEGAGSAVRARNEKGTMHPKLHLLEFDSATSGGGSGSSSSRFLRVVIASANLGDYESDLNNQFWVHDFKAYACNDPPPPQSAFGSDLLAFTLSMLEGNAPASLTAAWTARLKAYDLTPPPGVHLIASVPGRRPSSDQTFGTEALRRCLRLELEQRPAEQRHSLVEFAFSSVGRIEKLNWEPLTSAFRMGGAPPPPDGAPLCMHGCCPRAAALAQTGGTPPPPSPGTGTAQERARAWEASTSAIPVQLVWPSMQTMLATMGERPSSAGGGWWNGLEHGPVGPGGQWTSKSFPRHHFSHHVMPW